MEKKPKYYNQSQNKAAQKYAAANLDSIQFRVRKGERAELRAAADSEGLSMAQYLIRAVNEHAGRQVLTPTEG